MEMILKWRYRMKIFKTVLLKIFFSTIILTVSFHTFAAVKNKFISFTDTGGTSKPLVLIHAFPTDLRLWDPQQETLKKHFRVIAIDLWGFGKSAAVDGNAVTMIDFADEVKNLGCNYIFSPKSDFIPVSM